MKLNTNDEKKLYFAKINGISYTYMIISYKMGDVVDWFEKEMGVEPDHIEFVRKVCFCKDLTIQEA